MCAKQQKTRLRRFILDFDSLSSLNTVDGELWSTLSNGRRIRGALQPEVAKHLIPQAPSASDYVEGGEHSLT